VTLRQTIHEALGYIGTDLHQLIVSTFDIDDIGSAFDAKVRSGRGRRRRRTGGTIATACRATVRRGRRGQAAVRATIRNTGPGGGAAGGAAMAIVAPAMAAAIAVASKILFIW
jgi:hypothetical protein